MTDEKRTISGKRLEKILYFPKGVCPPYPAKGDTLKLNYFSEQGIEEVSELVIKAKQDHWKTISRIKNTFGLHNTTNVMEREYRQIIPSNSNLPDFEYFACISEGKHDVCSLDYNDYNGILKEAGM